MKLVYEEMGILALGKLIEIENLCSSCVNRGSTNCPSLISSVGEEISDFPHVRGAIKINDHIFVTSCSYFYKLKSGSKKKHIMRPTYVWDLKEKRYVRKK